MPLLFAFRRWWAIVFVAVLGLPALGHFLPDLPAPIRTAVAPEARWWEEANKRMDPYLNNTFGFRGAVLAAHRSYQRFIGAPRGPNYMRATDGSLFYTGENAVEQTIGHMVRPARVQAFVNWASNFERVVTSWGGKLVVVVAPNTQTIEHEKLPDYVRRQMKKPTEYDLLNADLTRAGLAHVDLRPLLAAAKAEGNVYWRYDTHWNQRGALIGFNAAMAAAGRPELEIDPSVALRPPEAKFDGDLLRLIGAVTADPPDLYYPLDPAVKAGDGLVPLPGLVAAHSPKFPFQPLAFETGHPGPRIMVLGDSFTYGLWKDFLAYRSSAFVWTHHLFCRADTKVAERFKPDILIVESAERLFPCPEQVPDWAATEIGN
jgi:hypothetical protein